MSSARGRETPSLSGTFTTVPTSAPESNGTCPGHPRGINGPLPAPRSPHPLPLLNRVLRARANPGPFAGFPFPDGPSHRSRVFEEMQTSRNGEGARFTMARPATADVVGASMPQEPGETGAAPAPRGGSAGSPNAILTPASGCHVVPGGGRWVSWACTHRRFVVASSVGTYGDDRRLWNMRACSRMGGWDVRGHFSRQPKREEEEAKSRNDITRRGSSRRIKAVRQIGRPKRSHIPSTHSHTHSHSSHTSTSMRCQQ